MAVRRRVKVRCASERVVSLVVLPACNAGADSVECMQVAVVSVVSFCGLALVCQDIQLAGVS